MTLTYLARWAPPEKETVALPLQYYTVVDRPDVITTGSLVQRLANSDLLKFELCARTGTPPSTVEVPMLTELIVIQGTKNTTKAAAAAGDAKPVSNVTFEGVTFTGQRPTYMEPHGLPSGYVRLVMFTTVGVP